MGDYLDDAMEKPERNAINFGSSASRRARGVPVYAAFKLLRKERIFELMDRCTELVERMAKKLSVVKTSQF
ncbi:hypothetical protein [Vibrio sp. T20]|uniref:hypothetical protein n=1 Tax=Vibrio sp. T20 TaxID=2588450 RepID=UPI0039657442